MNNKELLIDFIEYAKSRHVMPILNSNIEPLVDDYLSSRNIGNTHVSGSWSIGRKVEVTGCFHGHDFEIGEVVKIIEHEPRDTASWLCTNGKDNWWLSESEGNCR